MFEPVRMVGLWIQELVHVHAQCFSLGPVVKVSALKMSRERDSKILISYIAPTQASAPAHTSDVGRHP